MKKIGLFGGTFSPPHNGHLHAAKSFIDQVGLDLLYIMPANVPPHKEAPSVSAADRFEMCRLAFASLEKAEVSDLEIKREGPSYTVDTLEALADPDRELYMLCGTDMFLTLDQWYRTERICALATVVLSAREKDAKNEIDRASKNLKKQYGASVIILECEPFVVSSTDIRGRIASGEDTEGLLSRDVAQYIAEKGLYRPESDKKYRELLSKVEPLLDPFRFSHVRSVYEECLCLSDIFKLDPGKRDILLTSAILHDISKPYDKTGQEELAKKLGTALSKDDLASYPTIHAITGGPLAKKLFPDIATEEVINCVRWHSTGRADMTLVEKLLYLADFIEKTRKFDDCKLLRELFYNGIKQGKEPYSVLNEVMIKSFDLTVDDLSERGRFIHPDTLSAREFLRKS